MVMSTDGWNELQVKIQFSDDDPYPQYVTFDGHEHGRMKWTTGQKPILRSIKGG